MELDQKETPVEAKDEQQKDAQESGDPAAGIGEQPEEAQAGEIGFKKIFKFVGFKFTVKKEKSVKSEPVQLLTMKKDEDGTAGEAGSESPKQEAEGSKNGEVSPVTDQAEGSPPEVLTPGKVEECTGQAETKPAAAEEPLAPVESVVSPVESPAVDSPLKRFFKQGFFSGLRRKPSFKKAKDEPFVIEKTEASGEQKENGAQVDVTGDVNDEVLDHGAEAQPSTVEQASTSHEAAEILDVRTVEENREREDDFEDLTAELASVMEAQEALTVDEGEKTEVKENGVPAEQDQARGTALKSATTELEADQTNRLTARVEQITSSEGQATPESATTEAPAEPQAGQTEIAQEQSFVKASEPIMAEAELLSSREKAKLQGSPLKKLFTGSSIKKLSGKKEKGKKGETKLGDADDARMQSSTESEDSPESQKPESPLTSPEEMGETIPAEMVETDTAHPEVEEVNGAADGERRKESITAWASFKKLVTPKKRPKGPSESDKEDEQTDKAKSATISSTESAASVEKQEEPKSNAEEQKLERSTEDPKKKVDASVSWEALICVGSSKKRARKLSDSELPNEEAQKPMEESGQAQDHAEELKANSPLDTDQEQGGTSPECVESPVEGEAFDGAVSTWESFKRLMTPRRKSKSKLEERADESVAAATSTEAVLPETEPAKEESWVSLKKLIPGRRKKRSDAKPEQLQAECIGKETKWTELGESKSDEESDTPTVVPLSEYDAVEEERKNKEQQIAVETDAVCVTDQVMDEDLTNSEAPPQIGGPSAEQTFTVERGTLEAIKSSADDRSPSWISAAVSAVIEKGAEDEKVAMAEEIVAANELVMGQMVLGDTTIPAEVTSEICPDEIAEEAQEIISEVVTAPEYAAEESFTEETTEMVSAVSQLTETPVTTAEGTPIQEDEALVTRQTQEVLQEAAEKVKLSAGPIMSFCEMVAAPEMHGKGSEREPEISTEETRHEVVKDSCETEMPDSVQKGEAEKSDTASEASEIAEGTVHVARENLPQELGKTIPDLQEVAVPQWIGTETIPPMESAASACPAITDEVVQEMEVDAVRAGKLSIPQEEKVEGAVEMMHKSSVEIVVEEIVTAEIVRMVETGMSEAVVEDVEKARTEKVETEREEMLEASPPEDVEKPEATCKEPVEVTRANGMEKVQTECETTIEATMAKVAEKMGAEKVAGRGETTEVIPTKIAEEVEAIFEQKGEAIPEVSHQVGVGNVEAVFEENIKDAQEIGEVGAEKAVAVCRETLSVEKVEVECEQSAEITPEKEEVNVTEVVTSEETMQITPVVEVTAALHSEGTIEVSPAVGVAEIVCSKQTIDVSPVVEVTEVAHSIEAIEVSPVGGEESKSVHKGKGDLEITKQEEIEVIEEDVQKRATNNDKIAQEQVTAVEIVQQVVEAKEHVEAVAENMETEMTEAVSEEITKTLERIDEEQRTKGQVVETSIPATEIIEQEPSIEGLCKGTIGTTITEVTISEVVKKVETEIVEAVCDAKFEVTQSAQLEGIKEETQIELGKETDVVEIQKTETEVNQTITEEKMDPTVAVLSEDQFEISRVEKTELTETAETEAVESATKQIETKTTCVTNEPQITAIKEVEGTSLEQATEVVELVEKVGYKLATVAQDKPAPDEEVEFINKASHKDGALVKDDQLDATDKDGQDVAVPKQCKDTERANKAQKEDGVELANEATDKSVIKLESPRDLASTKALIEGCKEEPKLEVAPELKCLTLDSDHEVKLHSASIDEFQAVQNEMVTPIVDLSVAESSESHEAVFLVTAAAVEEQVIAETVTSVETEIPELSAVDQVLQPAEPDGVVQGPVLETAAAIVEAAIEAATGCLSDIRSVVHEKGSTLDVQELQSSRAEQLEDGLAEHKIKEIVEEKLESLETEVKVDQSRTFEQQSMMVAQPLIPDVVILTEKMEGQVDIPSRQEQDDDQKPEDDEEKIPGLQKVTATEGRVAEVVDQRVQTPGNHDAEAIEQEVLTQPTEIVSEATVGGVQEPVETEAVAPAETKGERESLPDRIPEEAAILPDTANVTKAENCQTLEKHEGTHESVELTERKDQLVKTQPLAEEQTSLQDIQVRMISSSEVSLAQGLASEKLEDDVMATVVHRDDKETDQNQTIEAVEKQGNQGMETGHQMGQSSTLECVKEAAEKTPS
ncbi:A-kinase anchor protein 12b isoform X2 [Heptranchias perlo]